MKHLPSIVAGIDFSSSSSQVLAHAAKLAAAADRALFIAHVIGSSRIKEWEESTGREAATADRILEMTMRLEELASGSCGGVVPEYDLRIGKPQKVLADIVRDHRADLLVLGAHDVAKRRLGSVASQCARSAPADVLLLRDWQERFFRKIAACVDLSPSSAGILSRAIEVAKAHGAMVEVIHVIFPPDRDPWGRVMEQRMDSEVPYEAMVREHARKRLDAFLRGFSGSLETIVSTSVILEGECPAAAINARVDAGGFDLTVIGSREGSWMSDFVLGSNTERLMQDSTSSVLITRA